MKQGPQYTKGHRLSCRYRVSSRDPDCILPNRFGWDLVATPEPRVLELLDACKLSRSGNLESGGRRSYAVRLNSATFA